MSANCYCAHYNIFACVSSGVDDGNVSHLASALVGVHNVAKVSLAGNSINANGVLQLLKTSLSDK